MGWKTIAGGYCRAGCLNDALADLSGPEGCVSDVLQAQGFAIIGRLAYLCVRIKMTGNND